MKVVVTAASRLAHALLPRLCAHEAVSAVIAIDVHGRFTHAKLRHEQREVSDRTGYAELHACDALIHLGFARARTAMQKPALFDLDVRAAHKLFHAARANGVKRLIHVSTAAVYGAAIHATEDAPLKPLPGFTHAEHHAHLEQLLAIEFPECVRLRPHMVVGSHAPALVKLLLKQPFYARFADEEPLFQCVHEDDVADALLTCLMNDARGAYNLAIDQSFTLRDGLRMRRGFAIPLPALAARHAIAIAARVATTPSAETCLAALSRTLIVNCRRAILELGWKPRFSARDALRSV